MMHSKTFLALFLAVGSICYVRILWKGHQSLYHTEGRATKAEQEVYSFRSGIKKKEMPLRMHRNPQDNRPPYRDVVDPVTLNITGNVESLIHFAVIGFGKCGTTSMISWFDEHPELQSFPHEVYDLLLETPLDLVRKIYNMPVGMFKRGFKSPNDLSIVHTMNYFRQYWPKTKLIVGIRHPVLWFESLYNFRIQNLKPNRNHTDFPKPNDLIGRCFKSSRNTCTYKGEFGLFIRNLGKTLAFKNPRDPVTGAYNVTEFEARMYRGARFTEVPDIQEPVPNPVFLFEIRQLADDNPVRSARFKQDLETFLELDTPLPPAVHQKPGRVFDDPKLQAVKDSLKINICDDEHIPVRIDLMRTARASSVWIQDYFLDPRVLASSDVVVSSRQYLISLLKDWMVDPCGEEATKHAGLHVLEAAREERKRRREDMKKKANGPHDAE